MKKRWFLCGAALLGAVCFVVAQDMEDEKKPPAGMGMMPAWMQKTKEHEGLKKLVGEWDAETAFWMAPGQPPMKSKATAAAKLIMNGNFIEQTFESNIMGQPYSGRLLLGYDTIDKEFVSVWVDTMSPVMGISRGKEADGVLTLHGMEPDHMTGKKKKNWLAVRWVNDDQWTITFYTNGPDGKEMRTGVITYTRKAG